MTRGNHRPTRAINGGYLLDAQSPNVPEHEEISIRLRESLERTRVAAAPILGVLVARSVNLTNQLESFSGNRAIRH